MKHNWGHLLSTADRLSDGRRAVYLRPVPARGERQVCTLGVPLCAGEALAPRNALDYLARRKSE